ncbi:restriction endonuclease subunit S [Micromonospora sp. 4G57]|uniref:Restriction endonuclease subunit S n=1 Tax=Micromonospora sicca TaxID=2202420 RepID=A0ABU5JP12_9ACTN|nr:MULTISPECIES: restriction endonuclease subunit S [unclassified Micromonospora]MDZ5447376.1 restriction endonuclease subunit S [Micromonospora sp. 4G57]MDZ5494059.1 restriction endonuclease subunit S [Micromonospora sp. 4G53]
MSTTTAVARLWDVASFVRGITFKPDDVVPAETPGSVLCMRTKNVQSELDLSDVWAVGRELVRREDQYLRAGDILVSSANSWNLVGKCCWVPELASPSSFGGFISVLRAEPSRVNARYLYHWFSAPRTQATVRSFGQQTTNISNLNFERCLKLPLPLPPLPEQRRIAEALDRADELRAKRRQALAHLDDLTQSIFLDMFGDPARNPRTWPMTRIEDVAEVQGGLQLSGSRSKLPIEVPYLRVANVYRGRLDLAEIKTLRASEAEVARTSLRTHDLLIVEGHGNAEEIGRAALWDGSVSPCVHQNHLIRARFGPTRIVPVFASYYVNSPGGRRHLLRAGKTTSGLNTISVGDVRSTPIATPPLDLQHTFAHRVAKVEVLKAAHRGSLAELNALFASVQDRAFRGLP